MRSYRVLPPGHQLVPTADGSSTLFSERFQENCHSTAGAETETKLHYLEGCEIAQKAKTLPTLTVLELGFGLGIGFLETFKLVSNATSLTFLSLEIDEALVEWFRQEHLEHKSLGQLTWRESEGLKSLELEVENLRLIILVGDARVTLPQFQKQRPLTWDAIYQDAFSPKRNRALWAKQWFQLLHQFATKDAILSTYSASVSVRKALVEAGWSLSNGPAFGIKKRSTRARAQGLTDASILEELRLSPILALSDVEG